MRLSLVTGLWLPAVAAVVSFGSSCHGSDSGGPSPVVTGVSIEGGRDTLYIGQTTALTAAVQLDSSTVLHVDTVSWTSGDTTRATVSSAGVVTARGVGAVVITAALAGHSGTRDLDIALLPVASVTVTPQSHTLYLGQSDRLTATPKDSAGTPITGRTVTWTSSDGTVASVDSTGTVTAHDTGAVRIRANVGGSVDSAAITVKIVPISSIAVLPAGDTAIVGDTLRPLAIPEDSSGAPLTGRSVTWTVSDSALLTPTGDGGFVAAGGGTVTLTAASGAITSPVSVVMESCADSVSMAGNAFHFPLVAGQLARDPSATIDAGVVSGIPVWYGGGVMFGTDSAHMLVAYDPRGDVGAGAASAGVCVLPAGSGVTYTYSKVRPVAGEGVPAGLRVVQETFASATAADSDFVLFKYTLQDTAATAVSGLEVGFFVDWDLNFDGDPANDILRYYPTLGYTEAEEPDTVTHSQRVAIVPVASSGTAGYGGWINGGSPGDPPTRGAYYGRLMAGTVSSVIGPQDIRQLVGIGPFTVPARGRRVVYFALVEGATQSAFAANRAAAIALANALGLN